MNSLKQSVEKIKELPTLKGHTNWVHGLAFSPNSQILASASWDNTIRLWDISKSEEPKVLKGHNDKVESVAFSPDGRLLASGSGDNTICLWDITNGQEFGVLKGHNNEVWSVAYSPDGRLLASGSSDRTIRLWDVKNGREVRVLKGHKSKVWSVVFSPDGRLLASGSTDGTIRLWEIETGEELQKFKIGHSINFGVAISPDGRLLAASGGTEYAIHLWDISALDVGPKTQPAKPERKPFLVPSEFERLINVHSRTLPYSHTKIPLVSNTAYWLKHTNSTGVHPPLFLVQDLGHLLSQPSANLTLTRPTHLPADVDTSAYLKFLQKLSPHPLIRTVSEWNLSEQILGVVLARLLAGVAFPAEYALPSRADEAVLFTKALAHELRKTTPAQIWRETKPADRPELSRLLPPKALAQIESNLNKLDMVELRFLQQYGPRFAGAPDPREMLDLFNLMGLPATVRLALSQVLQLVPRVSQQVTGSSAQTYAMGGYAGLTRKGSLDSLLPTELAYPKEFFYHRLMNNEALYYGRESEQQRKRELAYILTEMGLEILGDADVMARALTLALAQTLQKRGFEVQQSFVGSQWTKPVSLERPSDLHHLFYYRDKGWLHGEEMLQAVSAQLRAWGDRYQTIQLYWVVGEFWDADDYFDHEELYRTLKQKAGGQAWFIRVGNSNGKLPVTARQFQRYNVINTEMMWQKKGKLEKGNVQNMSSL